MNVDSKSTRLVFPHLALYIGSNNVLKWSRNDNTSFVYLNIRPGFTLVCNTHLCFRLQNIRCDGRYIVSAVAKVMQVRDSLQTLR